jgi:hypothetical protein
MTEESRKSLVEPTSIVEEKSETSTLDLKPVSTEIFGNGKKFLTIITILKCFYIDISAGNTEIGTASIAPKGKERYFMSGMFFKTLNLIVTKTMTEESRESLVQPTSIVEETFETSTLDINAASFARENVVKEETVTEIKHSPLLESENGETSGSSYWSDNGFLGAAMDLAKSISSTLIFVLAHYWLGVIVSAILMQLTKAARNILTAYCKEILFNIITTLTFNISIAN